MPETAPPDLAAIRAEIDRLDDQLHALLMRRAQIVADMSAARTKSGPPFRPGREMQILRRLLARHAGPLPAAALVGIWREIIATSLAQQAGFAVAVLAPAMDAPTAALARAHFGSQTALRIHGSAPATFAALSEAAVAVLPLPEDAETQPWWPMLEAPRLQILARLPVLDQSGPAALVVGPGPAEPSGDDVSLFRFEPPEGQSRAALTSMLTAAGFAPRRLITAPYAALVEVQGFLDPADPRLAALPFHGLRPLGAYALPVPGDAS
ncbi:chorismate mutase [Humitalea rosea]|uniref:chorismate mutase n=1 Tax=Humitalea rosea TaxID=990373 RepID=A0A2W7ISG4_9PROT|nr:chorismate mutase [Humitalea rosea]PZW50531.1 chorismate mutase [Humitalea rosea]